MMRRIVMNEHNFSVPLANNDSLQGMLWTNDDNPKAILLVVHGMTEHIYRYKNFAKLLTDHGIAVTGFDLRGHGKNLPKSGCASFGENGWEASLNDILVFSEYINNKYPNCPKYFLGFSLGSFLVREYLNKFNHNFSGAIIAGTGYQPSLILSIMLAIVKSQIRTSGFNNTTPLVKKLSFETYNTKFKPNSTDFDWLCSDKEQLNDYITDEFCANSISSGLFYQLLSSMKYTGSKNAYKNWKKDIPILLLSGDEDPVGEFSKGVRRVEVEMKKAGISKVETYLLPDARHDIFHEIKSGCAEQAAHIIIKWLNI